VTSIVVVAVAAWDWPAEDMSKIMLMIAILILLSILLPPQSTYIEDRILVGALFLQIFGITQMTQVASARKYAGTTH
jgi:hypothetical protein